MTVSQEQSTATRFPPQGHFGWRTMLGPHQPSPAAMLDTRGYFGLVPEGTFLYGNLRADDGDDGAMFEVTRRIPARDDRGMSGLVVQSTLNDDGVFHIDPIGFAAATSLGVVRELSEDGTQASWTSAPGVDGPPWRVTMTEDTMSWVEEGLFELTGELLPPGLQWYKAGVDLGTYYVSQLFQVSGNYQGRPVRGMIGLDRTYMPEGGMLYVRKDILVGEQLHNSWYTWATRYTDGSFEAGHFMLANDHGGFAIFTNDSQEVTATQNITGSVTPGSDQNFPDAISLLIDGVEWEFLPDPKGKMPDFLNAAKRLPTPQNEGRWRRKGDEREPDVWFAWGEIAPGHGLSPTDRWRG